jgi:hypothetical protein
MQQQPKEFPDTTFAGLITVWLVVLVPIISAVLGVELERGNVLMSLIAAGLVLATGASGTWLISALYSRGEAWKNYALQLRQPTTVQQDDGHDD